VDRLRRAGVDLEWAGVDLEWAGVDLEWAGVDLEWAGVDLRCFCGSLSILVKVELVALLSISVDSG
jgi:hypothetical protein